MVPGPLLFSVSMDHMQITCRYTVFERYDSQYGDLGYLKVGVDVSASGALCNQLGPACKGFGSYGYMKSGFRPTSDWRR